MKYKLYHKISPLGLNYLGITTSKDVSKYKGSGKYWKLHLKHHKIDNKDVKTIILYETDSHEDLRKVGLYYSELYDVINSDDWANLINETGEGVLGIKVSEETRKKISETQKRIPHFKHTDSSKKSISDAKKGKSINGKEIIDLETGFVLKSISETARCYNLNENILKKSIYKRLNKRFIYVDDMLYNKPKRIRKGGRKFSEQARENISKSCTNIKKVRHIESGKIFKSISEASKFAGMNRDTLTKQLYHKRKCEFEYFNKK
jgi:hypothetical protein